MKHMYCSYNLGQNIMKRLSPTPPLQGNDDTRRSKNAPLKWGRGGPDFSCILSKIVDHTLLYTGIKCTMSLCTCIRVVKQAHTLHFLLLILSEVNFQGHLFQMEFALGLKMSPASVSQLLDSSFGLTKT